MTKSITIEIGEWSEAVAWEAAFLMLAVRRCWPLLPEAGVPNPVAFRPRVARQVALKSLQAKRQLLRSTDRMAAYGKQLGRAFSSGLAALASEYGEDPVAQLYAWARRHFVDQAQQNLLWEWNMVFPRLADAWDNGSPSTPSPLSPDVTRRFTHYVRSYYSREIDKDLEERLQRAASVPLTKLEQDLLTYKVAGPEEKQVQDILQDLEMVIRRERAYRVWTECANWMESSELESLLQWVRAESMKARLGLPPETVELAKIRPYLPFEDPPRQGS